MAGKYDPCDDLGLGESHVMASEDLGTLSFKPRTLMDSESTCSIELMETMLLKRLLTKKELKIKSMLQRLEEQEHLIEDLRDKVTIVEGNQANTLVIRTVRSAAQFFTTGSGLIWRFLCGLAFYSCQVFSKPFYPSMLMMSMARLVARAGYAAAEMAENWDNECREVLEDREKVEQSGRSRESRRKMVKH